MGIKKILFRNIKDEYVIFKNKIFEYEYSHGVNKIFSEKDGLISDFIKNEKIYNQIINSDFNKFDVMCENNTGKDFSRKYIIECFKQRQSKGYHDYYTYRVLSPQDVSSFYRFEVTIEMQGVKIPGFVQFDHVYPDSIILGSVYKGLEQIPYKQIPMPMEPRVTNYLFSTKYIDKVIGIKRYKEINWIGTGWEHYDDFTSETEEYVLDLHHFDQDIYRIFKEHNALEILR